MVHHGETRAKGRDTPYENTGTINKMINDESATLLTPGFAYFASDRSFACHRTAFRVRASPVIFNARRMYFWICPPKNSQDAFYCIPTLYIFRFLISRYVSFKSRTMLATIKQSLAFTQLSSFRQRIQTEWESHFPSNPMRTCRRETIGTSTLKELHEYVQELEGY